MAGSDDSPVHVAPPAHNLARELVDDEELELLKSGGEGVHLLREADEHVTKEAVAEARRKYLASALGFAASVASLFLALVGLLAGRFVDRLNTPEASPELLTAIAGLVSALLSAMLGYYFASQRRARGDSNDHRERAPDLARFEGALAKQRLTLIALTIPRHPLSSALSRDEVRNMSGSVSHG